MKTKLGEYMGDSRKDHAIAAEFYNPGHTPGTDDRQAEINLETGVHDIPATAKAVLSAYASTANIENTLDISVASQQRWYVQSSQGEFDAQSEFETTSENDNSLRNLMRRQQPGKFQPASYQDYYGNSSTSRPSGHNLLSKYVKPNSVGNFKSTAYPETVDDARYVNGSVRQSLEQKNLHAPGRAFVKESGSGMEDESLRDGMYSLQSGNFGKFDPKDKRMLVEDLNKAVTAMLNNARGVNESSSGALDQIGDFLAPTIAVIQGTSDLRISNLENIISKFGNGISGQDDIARVRDEFTFSEGGGQTYGHMNTPSQPFNGIPFGMALTGYAGMLALRLAFVIHQITIEMVLGIYNKSKESKESKDSLLKSSVAFAGAILPTDYFTVVNELGLNSAISNYGNSTAPAVGVPEEIEITKILTKGGLEELFEAGFNEFYGYKPDGDGLMAIVNAANPLNYKRIFQTPAYYATIARLILRDATVVTDFVRGAKDSSSVGEGANAVLGLITQLTGSFTFRMCVQFIKLGLRLQKYSKPNNEVFNFPAINTAKDRTNNLNILKRQDNKSDPKYFRFADGAARKSLISLSAFPVLQFNQGHGDVGRNLNFASGSQGVNKIRFTPEDVNNIESAIDGDYIPFSIQDVRTNEIISLPAFIESVNDSFSVSYDSTHGYGRTDPIHGYSKTERSIDLSFFLVALNIDDHRLLYDTVNRLTSMCYPQRSSGTARSAEGLEFTQPFSQVPTASPLIRIRLGDLLRNNQTKSAFQWIFGDSGNLDNESRELQEKKLQEEYADFRAGKLASKHKIKLWPSNSFYEYSINEKDVRDVVRWNNQEISEFSIIRYHDGDISKIGNFLTINQTEGSLSILGVGDNNKFTSGALDFFYKNAQKRMCLLEGDSKKCIVLLEALPHVNAAVPTSISSFYAPSTNAVVRSFKSSSGRGLAGFIKNLQLDYSGFNWGIDWFYKAPLGVKVTMSFAPIHDMPLGLSHEGRMIAPSHMVGIPHYGEYYDNK